MNQFYFNFKSPSKPPTFSPPSFYSFLFLVILMSISQWNLNAQNLSFNNNSPADLMVCEEGDSFTIEFSNTSTEILKSVEMTLELPEGIKYEAGSVSETSNANVAENNISDLGQPSFTADNLATGAIVSFTVNLNAGFDAFKAKEAGQTFINILKVSYSGGEEETEMDAFNILYPALSITKVDPMSNTVFVGETFEREVTIVNGGYGSISSFVLKNEYDNNLQLEAVDMGSLSADKKEIVFSSADFVNIGNRDGRLDQNESITLTQKMTALGCESTQDKLTAFWGCEDQTSPSNTKYPYTTIQLFPPNLDITPTPQFGTCVDGSGDQQKLTITNKGTGPANSLQIEISPIEQNQYTESDINSIRYSLNGTTTSILPIATQEATNYDCFGTNAKDGFTVTLPTIAPGETLELIWNNYTCNTTTCGYVNYVGWEYEGSYTDMCESKDYEFDAVGQARSRKFMSSFYESPADLVDGQKGTYQLNINSATFQLPESDASHFEAVFNIPNGLVWSGDAADLKYVSSQSSWTADAVDYDSQSRVLTAKYQLPIPTGFSLNHSRFKVDLKADCSAGSSWVTVGMQAFYVLDSTCPNPYKITMTCKELPQTQLHCPGPCEHGLGFQSFDINRTSYGTADNDLDGLPDANNNLDLTKVKTNRVMVSDTFETTFKGRILTSATYPSWSYAYAKSNVPFGNEIAILSARVNIVDKSTGRTMSCEKVSFTEQLVNGERVVNYDFSPATLAANGCDDFREFVLEDEDEIELIAQYKVVGNIGGNAEQAMIQNEFYVSDRENGSKFQCNDWNGNFTIIGYYFRTNKAEQYNVKTCTKTISQTYKMSIGDCCTNYAGGNLFPYEYRNWSHMKEMRVEIPEGYSFVSGQVEQWRTAYTNKSIKETAAIQPESIDGTTHRFDIAALHIANGGTLNYSDDGYNGRISIEVKPECTVNEAANAPVQWYSTFQENDFLGGSVTEEYTSSPDYIKYYRPKLKLSTTLATQEGIAPTVSWTLKVQNKSAEATNAWFHLQDPTRNIVIQEVMDLSSNSVFTAVDGFYQIPFMAENETKEYKITATYNDCNLTTLNVTSGSDCEGYPTDLASFSCPVETMDLYLAPQPSELQVRFESFTNPLDACDNSIQIEIEMLSSKLATVEDLFVELIQPDEETITLELGSVEVLYTFSESYREMRDPVLENGKYYIKAGDMDERIESNGLVGVTDINSNRVKLRFNILLDNNYKPGHNIHFNIGGSRPCGDPLPTLSLAFDPSGTFERPEDIGLDGLDDAWAMAWGDYNNDGNVDLFVTTYDVEDLNRLYKNNGDGTFTRVMTGVFAADKGSSLGASWGDYDNDGDLDLLVANNIGFRNFLYRNDGGNFTKIQNDPLVDYKGYAHGITWVDYDNDGYLDAFLADYFSTRFNQLFHNNGDGTFSKASAAPSNEASSSIAGIWGDYNNDGWVDLFVANHTGENNSLYKNIGNGQFEKVTNSIVVTDGGKSVGASWGDYDNDGDLDLFVSNAGGENNALYRNDNGTFVKLDNGVIVNDGGNSHGSSWADYDNDGDLDLFVANDADQDNFLYANNGDGSFTKVVNGITQDGGCSFGAAWADIDNDGDVDLFVANRDMDENFIYLNSRGKCQSKSCIVLVGTKSNRSAVGAKIHLKANVYGKDLWQMREITAQSGGGVGGQNELKTIIGLGDAAIVDSIIVEWPSGHRQILTDQIAGDCFTIVEERGSEVCGVVYYDENQNCQQDEEEKGIANMRLVIQPGNQAVVTDENGKYSFIAGVGEYEIEQETEGTNWAASCDAVQKVEIRELGEQICGFNFADTATCVLPDLQVEASATATRIGFESVIALTYRNAGTSTATNVRLTAMFGDYILPIESSLPWDMSVGTDRRWNLGDVPAGTNVTIYVKDSISTKAEVGQELAFKVTIYSDQDDCDGVDNAIVFKSEAVGAFDPNDIAVSPEGYIKNDQELVYKIRFQNVGNAAVSTVRVEDQLPEDLDISSLELGVTSHNYRFEIQDGNTLVWLFENINLPDSLNNEPESHGFIYFKIRPKAESIDGITIDNKAAIYFDNLDPIETNTVVNIIGKERGDLATNSQLHVFPNPMMAQTRISIVPEENTPIAIQSFYLYNMNGEEMISEVGVNSIQVELTRGNIPTGNYIVKIIGEDGKEYYSKLLVIDEN